MRYTLLTAKGKLLVFTVKACADLYQEAYGGVVFTSQVLAPVLDTIASCDTMATY